MNKPTREHLERIARIVSDKTLLFENTRTAIGLFNRAMMWENRYGVLLSTYFSYRLLPYISTLDNLLDAKAHYKSGHVCIEAYKKDLRNQLRLN